MPDTIKRKKFTTWNKYRQANPGWAPDLSEMDLMGIDFRNEEEFPDFSRAILLGTKLPPENYFTYRGKFIDLNGAIYNSETKSSFDLAKHGALFVTQEHQARISAARQKTVFISYAWANGGVIDAIDHWLRQKGFNVRIDRRDFFAGSRIRDEILRIMKESDAVLIFYSKESKDKPWPVFEQELAADLEMAAKHEGRIPPRIIYVVIDDTPLPNVSESNKIAVMAKGKRFELVCEEIYHNVLQLPKPTDSFDLNKWSDYVF
jgi:hypothetical protein